MKKQLLILLLHSIFGQFLYGQIPSSSYPQLKTKKDYNFNVSFNPQIAEYKVRERKVDKATYLQYKQIKEDAQDCCPCIRQTYNMQEKLLREGIACGDCSVGWFKEYYPNGLLKLAGQFKENDTGNWDNIYKRGYCNVPDGKWIFYNKKGVPQYVELWDKGIFLKQIPEQKEVSIWAVDFLLAGKDIQLGETLSINDVKNISIIPKFKNSHTSVDLLLKIELSLEGHQSVKHSCSPEALKNIPLKKLISEIEASKNIPIHLNLSLYNGDRYITHTALKIRQ